MEPLLYSRRRAADALSLSLRSIDHLVAQGRIKTLKVGRKTMITRDEVTRFASTESPDNITPTTTSTLSTNP